MSTVNLLLIPFLPLFSFVILGLAGRRFKGVLPGWIGTVSLLISTILSVQTAVAYFSGSKLNGAFATQVPVKITWLKFTEQLSIDMGILLDPISVMMIVVVSFISLLVHLYSIAYLKGEERFGTYYSFLSLFTFSMLGLVLSCNIFQTYIFWELVGVSSFLLIGYYYHKPTAVAASKKAFIVTRFADLGFLIGILLLSYYAETLDFLLMTERLTDIGSEYAGAASAAGFLGFSALTWGLVLVFIGGAGKSAMFPLHIWLPDAMEGPTPVSALIHAATMVVAGVYLVARLFPVFSIACPGALEVVAWTGVLSALFAALIACTQTDIKRVLAYSTMSQIGYMMFALGVAGDGIGEGLGYTASMFHLFTHAMFKALLFLGAGLVIHAVHSNEMKDMGGLRRQLPLTHAMFLVACLAIAGIPPFAGFFSKEAILTAAEHSKPAIYIIALITVLLTAFYMFRLYFMIFWNKENRTKEDHHGEGSVLMLAPVIILGILSLLAGFVPFGDYVSAGGEVQNLEIHWDKGGIPIVLALSGILVAWKLYYKSSPLPDAIAGKFGALYRAVLKKFYIDELYLFVTKKIIVHLIARPAAWIDKNIVDGFMNLLAAATQLFSISVNGLQSGKVQSYAAYFLSGTILLVLLFLYILA